MRRALHYVFRIGDRAASYRFYVGTLGMKVLRHEEFEGGCPASCNGPYDGRWSKTMVGYGQEDDHFVIELTYNYQIGSYELGNDYQGVWIKSDAILDRLLQQPSTDEAEHHAEGSMIFKDPDGHPFIVTSGTKTPDPISKFAIAVTDLAKSTDYYVRLCGMKLVESDKCQSLLTYAEDQCHLLLRLLPANEKYERGTAYGRIAFSCPSKEQPELEALMKSENQTILTPLVSLDTPGKATVQVVIVADPDGHEICFVGDEAYRELSKVDPNADQLLNDAMEKDKSAEWFQKKHKGEKPSAE